MKIKIIDLLVKIANNEEVPKKIKWQGQIYEYSCSNRFYYQNSWSMYRDFYKEGNCLNEDVEIIEEDKKIEKLDIKQEKNIKNNWKWKCNGYNITTTQKIVADKLNELIDEINNLKEND